MPIQAPQPSAAGQEAIARAKAAFEDLDRLLMKLVPRDTFRDFLDAIGPPGPPQPGQRELALARTQLEQASMWATKAICNAFPEPEVRS